MGICEVLTIIFVIAKLLGKIDWSWPIVFLPEIIAFVIYAGIILFHIICIKKAEKDFKKTFGDMLDQ